MLRALYHVFHPFSVCMKTTLATKVTEAVLSAGFRTEVISPSQTQTCSEEWSLNTMFSRNTPSVKFVWQRFYISLCVPHIDSEKCPFSYSWTYSSDYCPSHCPARSHPVCILYTYVLQKFQLVTIWFSPQEMYSKSTIHTVFLVVLLFLSWIFLSRMQGHSLK